MLSDNQLPDTGKDLNSIEMSLWKKLLEAFKPVHLQIENESSLHHRNPEGETHFKVFVVSEKFQNIGRVDRQRSIQELFSEERAQGLHALSLRAWTPQEWQASLARNSFQEMQSPTCQGKGI